MTPEDLVIRACRRALREAGWQVAEGPPLGRAGAVRATRKRPPSAGGDELVLLRHPEGRAETYLAACAACGVTPDFAGAHLDGD